MNFGNFTDESALATTEPYVQLLSVTNQAAALNEFKLVRGSASTSGTAGAVTGGLSILATVFMASLVLLGSL